MVGASKYRLRAGSWGGCWAPRPWDGLELSTHRHAMLNTGRGMEVQRSVGGLCAQGGAPACPGDMPYVLS